MPVEDHPVGNLPWPSPAARATVHLVYARSGPAEDEESVEPLVAVVGDEVEARALKADIEERDRRAFVSWEDWVVEGTDPASAEVVHVVLQGHDGPGMPDYPDEMTGPIGVAVHATRTDADAQARQLNEGDGIPHVVRSLPLGYRREGWPFSPRDEP